MGKNLSDSPLRSIESWKTNTFEYSAKDVISVKTEKREKPVALKKHIEMTKKIQNSF